MYQSSAARDAFLVAAVLLSLLLPACGADMMKRSGGDNAPLRANAMDPAAVAQAKLPDAPDVRPGTGNAIANRKIIRDARLGVVVEEWDAARQKIESLVRDAQGYIAQSGLQHHAGRTSHAHLRLRIPVGGMDRLLGELRQLGEVTREELGSEDITAQYVDLEARLRNANRLEERLLALLAERTAKLEDIVAVEHQLANVRERIERMESQKRSWDDLVVLATIELSIEVREDYVPSVERGFGSELGDSFSGSADTLVGAGKGLLRGLVAIVPWLPLIVLAFFGLRVARRRLASHNEDA